MTGSDRRRDGGGGCRVDRRVHRPVADVAVDGRVLLVRYRDTARYDGQRGWFLHHLARVNEGADLVRGPNTLAAEWFALDALPPASEVAHHGWALDVLQELPIPP
jgi:hypothetical protein